MVDDSDDWVLIVVGWFLGILIGGLVLVMFVGMPLMVWKSAGVKAELYNAKFGTHYSTRDFFFAGDTIKEYLNQGEQKTYNVKLGEER